MEPDSVGASEDRSRSRAAQFELRRAPNEPELYSLGHIGTLRWDSPRRPFVATADTGPSRWRIAQGGRWRQHARATDASGKDVGVYRTYGWLRSGGTLSWEGRDLALRPASQFHVHFTLDDEHTTLATLAGNHEPAPVSVTLDDIDRIDEGLLLFAAFIVNAVVLCTV